MNATQDKLRRICRCNWPELPQSVFHEWGKLYVGTLERLRDEREQVFNLLQSGHVNPDARPILEDLLNDLDRSIDQELTRRLSPNYDSDSKAAD